MIPRIVHQTAPTTTLTPEEQRLVERNRRTMPGWTFRLWDDAANRELVAEHFPQYLDRYDAITRGVAKADIARLMYAAVFGGLYIDTDYVLLKPFPEELLNARCVLTVSRGSHLRIADDDFRVCNAIFASEKGYPLWRDFLDHIFSASELGALRENRVEQVTGPEGLTDFYKAHLDRYEGVTLTPRTDFHPRMAHRGLRIEGKRHALGAHMCWGSWRSKGLRTAAWTLMRRKVLSRLV